jgi:hypothetical protein
MHLHARAGIDNLGPYLSRGNQEKVDKALAQLSRAVTMVAVDYSLERALGDLASGLVPERDNRSVTDPEWVEKGISSYGCPIHTTSNGTESEFTVSGHGPCSCRRTAKVRRAGVAGTGRSSRHDQSWTTQAAPVVGQGGQRVRFVLADSSERNGRTALPDGGVRSSDPSADHSRPFTSDAYKGAIRAVYDTAGGKGRGKLPLSVDEVVAAHILPNSYAGAPLFRSNRDVLDQGRRLANRIVHDGRGFDPYVFGRRVQPGNAGPKTRLVWMAPLPTTIVGTRYSKRVMENLSRKRPFIWGLRGHERGALISEIETRYRYVYSMDFSKFDSTVPARMIDDAFRVARTHLDLDDRELDVWRRYVNDFIHSRIIAPDGNVYQKHKGVPSGSAFTSIIDSIVNLILVSYMWEKLTGHSLPHDRVLVMGDDIIVGSNARLTKAQLASAASDLGFVMSVEKTTIIDTSNEPNGYGDRTHFVGYWWHHSHPNRPEKELLQRMVYPERHRRREAFEWVVRLLGYAATSRQGLFILAKMFPHPDTLQVYLRAADKATELGWDEDYEPDDADLPGQLRYERRVEGRGTEVTPARATGGIFGRWT